MRNNPKRQIYFGGHGSSSGSSSGGGSPAKVALMPEKVEGTREERAAEFERIDRMFPDPPGIMSSYEVEMHSSNAMILFEGEYLRGEAVSVNFPSGSKASESERAGAIKHAVYNHREALEIAAFSRRGGFPDYDMASKYGGRVITNAEKKQADKEIKSTIKNLFKSPMSKAGEKQNASFWKAESGGWRRLS